MAKCNGCAGITNKCHCLNGDYVLFRMFFVQAIVLVGA